MHKYQTAVATPILRLRLSVQIPNGCSDTNFTATIKCTNPKTEIQSEMNETQIIGINISFVIKLELKVIKQSFYHLSMEKLFCTGKIILL